MPKIFHAAAAKPGDVVVTSNGATATVLAVELADPCDDIPLASVVVWIGPGFNPYIVTDDGRTSVSSGMPTEWDVKHFAPVIESFYLVPNSVNTDRGQYFSTLEEALKLCPCPIPVTREV